MIAVIEERKGRDGNYDEQEKIYWMTCSQRLRRYAFELLRAVPIRISIAIEARKGNLSHSESYSFLNHKKNLKEINKQTINQEVPLVSNVK